MPSTNKHNIQYFESATMAGLHQELEMWQIEHKKRLLSTSIEKDGDIFCCIALTNPTEVTLYDPSGQVSVDVTDAGRLRVTTD
jgi:hypothetical protein